MDANTIKELIAWCEANNISRIEWTIYYLNDQNEFDNITGKRGDEEVDLLYSDIFTPSIFTGDHDIESFGWELADQFSEDTGVFSFDVAARTFSRDADTDMPEPILDVIPLDEPETLSLEDVID